MHRVECHDSFNGFGITHDVEWLGITRIVMRHRDDSSAPDVIKMRPVYGIGKITFKQRISFFVDYARDTILQPSQAV